MTTSKGKKKKIIKNEIHNIVNIQSKTSTSNIEIENMEGYLKERFYYTDIFDDQKLKQFTKKTESLIRRSDGYKSFIGSCHEKGLNRCAILGNIQASKKVNIEIHHYPFTLYDIVFNEIMYKLDNKEKFTSITIARDVLQLHHEGLISVVPLCETVHSLAHEGLIFINFNSCAGNLAGYVEKYEHVMDEKMKEDYNKLLEMSEKGIYYSDTDLLKAVRSSNVKIASDDIDTFKMLESQQYADLSNLERLSNNGDIFNNEEE